MNAYPLVRNKYDRNSLMPTHTWNTEEFVAEHNDLYISDKYEKLDNGNIKVTYRLHARQPHNIEMALAYDIKCPRCSTYLKQVGRCLDSHVLGLYECPACRREREKR